MNKVTATRLAAWINTHDDGSPQPRATVVLADDSDEYQLVVTVTAYLDGAVLGEEREIATTERQVRDILGY